MSESYVGQIKMFAGNFAPLGWAYCDGQLLAVSQYDALFSLLGTTYGGDGMTTFALPDLRGRVAIGQGDGPGLAPRKIGARGGEERVTLTAAQLPAHDHGPFQASTATGTEANPAGNVVAASPSIQLFVEDAPSAALDTAAVTYAGDGQPHDNMIPFQCVHYIISLYGIYPSRN